MMKMEVCSHALISLSDKTNVKVLAEAFTRHNIGMISTGGTAQELRDAGYQVMDVSQFTGFPEMFDGRVKTLHPRVAGGILYIRNNPGHVEKAREHSIVPIDFVVVNLYPFERVVAKPETTFEVAVENIDIGGPTFLRAAGKNHQSVTVVCDPAYYPLVIKELDETGGRTSLELRKLLMTKMFRRIADYDNAIATYMENQFIAEAVLAETITEDRVL